MRGGRKRRMEMATAAGLRTYGNFINGEWVEGRSGKAYENRNPANTDELIGMFAASTSEDVDLAVDAATEAYKTWRLVPAPKRAEILFRAAELLVQRKEQFAKDMTREMGKVLAETRGDVQEAIDMTYYMAGEGRRLFGQTTPSELPNKFAMSVRQPVGVCGLITPWNFPMAIPAWKMMAALAQRSGVPVVSFTGSTAVGLLVAEACAPQFKHCSLEMGGKNIILLMEDANLDLAIDGAVWGGFGTTGQRCTAASRVAVHKSVYKEFTHRFVERAKALRVGNGLDSTVDMGPCINEQQLKTVMSYVEIGKNEGAKLLTGGRRLESGAHAKGWFHEPTVFGDVSPKMRIAQEEIFGPVVSVIPIGSFEEGVEVANGVAYGLSASIYTRNVNRAFTAMRDMYTGIVYVNAPTIGAETHLPFGGTKQTGNGHREAAVAAIDFFTEWKTLYIDYSDRLQRAQIDNN